MNSYQYNFEAIGTQWTIEVFEPGNTTRAALQSRIMRIINDFDKVYSRFRDDSLVTQISKKSGTYRLPRNADKLFAIYRILYDATDGKCTPLIGNTLEDIGYDAQYSLIPQQKIRTAADWDDVMVYKDCQLIVRTPVLLDFGAAGKGYLVDLVSEALKAQGVYEFCINAGGDMRHVSNRGTVLSVALEHPDDITQAVGVTRLSNQSLCGSAGNRRTWSIYHHVIDPQSLQSPRHIKAVWVAADECIVGDALTTALYFTEPQVLARYFTFEYAIMTTEDELRSSPGFLASFFTDET